MSSPMNRRRILAGAAATTGLVAMPAILRAQGGPIKIGTLTPLTAPAGSTARRWPMW